MGLDELVGNPPNPFHNGADPDPLRNGTDQPDPSPQRPLTIKQILTQLGGLFPMDNALIQALPEGDTFVSVKIFAARPWTITGKLETTNKIGEAKTYFVKVAYGETGRVMLNGEYESGKAIYGIVPNFLPKPISFGRYESNEPATYFNLSEFMDMDVDTEPDPAEFTARLAQMHKNSQSPNNKFGFHILTCDGDRPHVVEWQDSWSVFYRNLFLGVCKLDIARNKPWPEYELAVKKVADHVIPRLLEPLQQGDRQIKPCIIHGDLWEGNMGISRETDQTLLFDVGSYFAHNEMELGHWRCEFTTVFRKKAYTENYLRNYPAAEPVDEFDDRNRLYSLKGAINYSAGHTDSELRKTAYNNMCYLIEKYCPIDGIDKYDPGIDPSLTGATIVPHLADGLL